MIGRFHGRILDVGQICSFKKTCIVDRLLGDWLTVDIRALEVIQYKHTVIERKILTQMVIKRNYSIFVRHQAVKIN